MSAPVARADARTRTSKAANRGRYARKVGENAMEISLCEFLMFNSRCGGVVQTFPKNPTHPFIINWFWVTTAHSFLWGI